MREGETEIERGETKTERSRDKEISVADPGCLSRITYPGSLISDPKTAAKERGEKKFVVIPFL